MIHHRFPSKRTRTIIALLSKGFGATSPLRFTLTRQKGVSSFDFSKELLVVHNRNEWWGSVDCVILTSNLSPENVATALSHKADVGKNGRIRRGARRARVIDST
jgi:homospermidine synthase